MPTTSRNFLLKSQLHIRLLFVASSLLIIIPINLFGVQGQTTDVSGRVLQRQPDGSVAPAHYIVGIMQVQNADEMVTTETDENGRYVFSGVPVNGIYSIVVLAEDAGGNREFVTGITKVRLTDGAQFTLTVEMEDLAAARKRAASPRGKSTTATKPNSRRAATTGTAAKSDVRTPEDTPSEARRRLNADVEKLYESGKIAEALPVAKQLLELTIRERGSSDFAVGHAHSLLGLIYGDLGDYQAATESFRQALQILERALGPTHLELASVLYNLASMLEYSTGDLQQMEMMFLRALDIRKRAQGADHPDTSFPIKGLARVYQAKGDFKQAETFYLRALALAERGFGPEHEETVEIMHDLATLYSNQGIRTKAEEMYLRVLRLDEKRYGQNHPTVAKTLNNIGAFYLTQSDFRKAQEYIMRGLEIRREVLGENHPDLASSMMTLGQLYAITNQSDDALSLFKRAVEIEEKAYGKTSPALIDSLARLSTLYQELEDYAQAEPLIKRELAILEEAYGGDHPTMPGVLHNLAGLYRDYKHDYPQAEILYRRALVLEEKFKGPDHPYVADILSGMANLFLVQAAYAKAEPLFLRALTIEEKTLGPHHRSVATTLNWLALVYRAMGDKNKAIEYQSRGNQARELDLLTNMAGGSERQKFGIHLGFMLETDLTVSFHAQVAPDSEPAARLAITTILQRKGRAMDGMSATIRVLRRRGDPNDVKLLDELAATRSMLATFSVSGFGADVPIAEQQEDIAYLTSKAEDIEGRISLRAVQLESAPLPLTLEDVQRLIPTDAALVEFYTYQPYQPAAKPFVENFKPARYIAYVVRSSGVPQAVDLGDVATIDLQLDQWRAALRDANNNDAKAIGRVVDQRLMQPVRKLLGSTRRLLLSPDGNLNLIPFGALVGEDQHYLIETYTISYLSSGRDLQRLQESFPSKQGAVVFADPLYDQGRDKDAPAVKNNQKDAAGFAVNFTRLNIKSLPGTRDEAARLKELMPDAQIYLESQATEAAVKQVAGPRILHLATHGFFFTEKPTETGSAGRQLKMTENLNDEGGVTPMLGSGLVLAGVKNRWSGGHEDGVLTAMEVTGLNLWGTKLVVLSACETGLGWSLSGEGVFGLRRALALAGSESQVMSLWKVDDAATRDLMVNFYQGLLKGTGRTESLRQAQLDMLHDNARVHPYYWAGFIQSGAWTSMASK